MQAHHNRSRGVLGGIWRQSYPRAPHEPIHGAEGIERLWEISTPLLDGPPPVLPYAPGGWGPDAVHDLIAPRRWHLPDA